MKANLMDVDLKSIFDFLNKETDIAVGLSGGGDSMALSHMLCTWASANNKIIHALTIDHNLREDSGEEAQKVASWVENFPHINHTILRWSFDQKPESAVMEKARNSRYDLMQEYCNNHNIKTLCIAHHADDQVETMLFRLAKGSGLDGLCSMADITDMNGVNISRPVLDMSHADLIQYCKDNDLNWIEDPSNDDMHYARPRLRQALQKEGLDAKRVSKTATRLRRAKEALDWMVVEALKSTKCGDNMYRWDALTVYPLDIQIRALNAVLMDVGGTKNGYPPKLERVEDIVDTLRPGHSATLYGCVITCSKDGKTLAIQRS